MSIAPTPPRLVLAPMEGVVDDVLRDVLTRIGGIDWCVSEFIRVSDRVLPSRCFTRLAPELERGARTPSGTPMHLQLLGSEPEVIAENAVLACQLGAPVIDLNFGCPAKTVNKSRGGAVLLDEPELLHRIAVTVRSALPPAVALTAKIRLGVNDASRALDCASALEAGGIAQLVVHARTKAQGYRPPAQWEWIAKIQDHLSVPVIGNGEIWTTGDWQRYQRVAGMRDAMIGRGLIAQPDLGLQIKSAALGQPVAPMPWRDLLPYVQDYWHQVRCKLPPAYAPGRLKQWLYALAKSYPEAATLFAEVRRERDCGPIDARLQITPHRGYKNAA